MEPFVKREKENNQQCRNREPKTQGPDRSQGGARDEKVIENPEQCITDGPRSNV